MSVAVSGKGMPGLAVFTCAAHPANVPTYVSALEIHCRALKADQKRKRIFALRNDYLPELSVQAEGHPFA
jgi:hypothetical protein